EWFAAVRTAYRALRAECSVCGVVGLSLGAVLARLLFDEALAPDALVLLAMPWRIDDPLGRALLPRLRGTSVARRWIRIKDGGPDISDPEARARSVSYAWTSLYAVAEVDAALRAQRRTARPLGAPVLMLHGAHDHVAALAGAREAARRFGGDAQLEVMPRSWHVLTQDVEAERVAQRVAAFLDQVLGSASC
ncbi:MAG: alpha/beta hydrolase, partial [Candidatus Dadabacteria bacterium]